MNIRPRNIGSRPLLLTILLLAAAAGVATLLPSGDTLAQDAPSTAPAGLDEQAGYQLIQLFMFSPTINGIILGLSVIALALFVLLMLTINSRAIAPNDLVDEVRKLIQRRQFDRATDVCRRHRRVFVATVIQRCLEHAGQPPSVLHSVIDAEGRRRADVIWNRVSYLADISNITPMLGLFGTVIGMIKAFFSLESASGAVDATILSKGIGQAMATTLFGLGVGILALMLYSIVKGRATRTLADAEAAVTAVADEIAESESYARAIAASSSGTPAAPAQPAHPLRRATDYEPADDDDDAETPTR